MAVAARRQVGPRSCIEEKPSHQSIRFCGRYISLAQLAKEGRFNHGYLSRIFASKRRAGVDYLERIADALGMSLEEFRDGLKALKQDRDEQLRRRLDL